jgi:ABC-type cobalamin transport system ATPase subunit
MLVTDTLPRYINVKSPLGPEEAKLLARLLEMLASKTTVRINGTHMDSQKAESLAKPFSKHAAYVLKSYIEAMNDPLCIIPSNVRKELQSGLYALCGMMNDHSRDAMMVSALDAGGKTTMKTLWKEYEKQRYIGKG